MRRFLWRVALPVAVVASSILAPIVDVPARAAWVAQATGSMPAQALTLAAGPRPTVSFVVEVALVSRRYTVTWTPVAVDAASGQLATGYVVTRTSPGTQEICRTTPTSPLRCEDVLLLTSLTGAPTYRVSALYENWTGPAGPANA